MKQPDDDLEDYEQVLFELKADGNPDRDVALLRLALPSARAPPPTRSRSTSERKPRERDRGPRDGGKDCKGGRKAKRGNVGPGTGLIYVGVGRRGHTPAISSAVSPTRRR